MTYFNDALNEIDETCGIYRYQTSSLLEIGRFCGNEILGYLSIMEGA